MATLVEFKQVQKKYSVGAGTVLALDGVSMSIEQGEFVSVIGPSGSGKSTLMHMLGFLDQPTAGTILFEGQDVSKISPRQRATIRANRIGFVFQAFNLLPADDGSAKHAFASGVQPGREAAPASFASASQRSAGCRGNVRPRSPSPQPAIRRAKAARGHRPGAHQRAPAYPGG